MHKKSSANVLAKECIVLALIELMKVKKYEEISITDISRRAGVSRMTYYRNYSSKDDILNKYMEEVGEKIHSSASTGGEQEQLRYFRILFEQLGEHSDIGIAVYNANMGELILNNINKQMKVTLGVVSDDLVGNYRVNFVAGAFYKVFIEWLKNGKQQTGAEMAALFCGILNHGKHGTP